MKYMQYKICNMYNTYNLFHTIYFQTAISFINNNGI